MSTATSPKRPAASPLERFLTIFTEVRPGEGLTALLMTLNIFLLLAAYYVIKPVRDGLMIAMKGGAEYKSYLGGAIAISLLFAVPAYAAVAKRAQRNRLVVGVTLFFVACLVVFYALSSIPAVERIIGIPFFIWVGIFNMMVVAQFWAFANDLYTEEQGKRLFALIGIGASTGAAAGSAVAGFLTEVIGVYPLLGVCAAMLALCALLTQIAHVRESRPAVVRSQLKNTMAVDATRLAEAASPAKPAAGGDDEDKSGSFSMVFRHRYLILLAAFSLLFTFANTNGEFILDSVLSRAADGAVASGEIAEAAKKAWSVAWKGRFFFGVNVLGVVLQSFVVSRLVKLGGIRLALLVFPAVALLDATALVVMPLLLTVQIGKTIENASDYSVNNTARNMLWLPTTRAMKYQAKQAVDTFFVRMGDVGSAALVFVGLRILALTEVRFYALVNVALAIGLVFLCRAILKEQEALKKTSAGVTEMSRQAKSR